MSPSDIERFHYLTEIINKLHGAAAIRRAEGRQTSGVGWQLKMRRKALEALERQAFAQTYREGIACRVSGDYPALVIPRENIIGKCGG